jgi:hypothetical protein
MIDIKLKYQASIFVDADDIAPSPDIISSLIDVFRDRNLVPNTFSEIGPTPPVPKVRLRLSTTNNEWNVAFGTRRIDVDKNPVEPKGSNVGELSDFCSDAIDFFERILKRFNKRANRLSLNTNGLFEEMTKDQLSAVYKKLFSPTKFYDENPPFEWDWRSVSLIPINILELKDSLNVITIIKRIRGEIGDQSGISLFDRLQFAPDINTTDRNTDYRFELTHMRSFYPQALEIHNSLTKQIEEYIHA